MGSCGAARSPTWGWARPWSPERSHSRPGVDGRGALGHGALPVTQAQNYACLAPFLLRRASWWEAFLSPARRESTCSSPAHCPRSSQHHGGQKGSLSHPGRASPAWGQCGEGATRGQGAGTLDLEPPSQFETAEGASPAAVGEHVSSRGQSPSVPRATRSPEGGPGGLALDSCRSPSWESACGSSFCLPGCSHGSHRKAEGSGEPPWEGLEGADTSFTVCTWEPRPRPPPGPRVGHTRAPGPGSRPQEAFLSWGGRLIRQSCFLKERERTPDRTKYDSCQRGLHSVDREVAPRVSAPAPAVASQEAPACWRQR